MTILPDNGASMFDAANTRENERPDICDDCDNCPDECGYTSDECEAMAAQAAAEGAWEGAREARE